LSLERMAVKQFPQAPSIDGKCEGHTLWMSLFRKFGCYCCFSPLHGFSFLVKSLKSYVTVHGFRPARRMAGGVQRSGLRTKKALKTRSSR
jgi:hypothetical protein